MTKLRVQLKKTVDESYDIIIGRKLTETLIRDIHTNFADRIYKVAVLTDSNVEALYGREFLWALQNVGIHCDLFTFPSGEKNKSREIKIRVEDEMIASGYGRDSLIIALGGGMVSDLSGFIASTFCRGIPYINYSTTLLSAADAAIGGKTAVNTPAATNLIGSFYQPSTVYADLETWNTLSVREFRSGLAETIIHACLGDFQFFEYLELHAPTLFDSNSLCLQWDICEYIVRQNCEIKYKVVMKDEKEDNYRKVLNLGHTIGRALEASAEYKYLHGEAVAIGLVAEARLANHLGFLKSEDVERIIRLLGSVGLPTECPKDIDPQLLIRKMYTDKKTRNGNINLVLMNGIGEMRKSSGGSYAFPVDEQKILSVLCS
ncbi:3-dehydroquinate synthase [Paenibacillus sp. HW567]|uniref:3-dehydroquinate synthase n=1 Tax=Paenibacillus sp. HW567 TaxID=1034769 RepID=UPI00037ABF7B|nr:3-dehydroquinate synthase [Paenibacillus sp. HW567]